MAGEKVLLTTLCLALLLLFGFRFRLFHEELLRMSHKSSKWFYVFLWCSLGMKEIGLCEPGLDSIFKYIFWGFRGFERQQNYFEIPLIRFFFFTQKQQTSLQSKNRAWHSSLVCQVRMLQGWQLPLNVKVRVKTYSVPSFCTFWESRSQHQNV